MLLNNVTMEIEKNLELKLKELQKDYDELAIHKMNSDIVLTELLKQLKKSMESPLLMDSTYFIFPYKVVENEEYNKKYGVTI